MCTALCAQLGLMLSTNEPAVAGSLLLGPLSTMHPPWPLRGGYIRHTSATCSIGLTLTVSAVCHSSGCGVLRSKRGAWYARCVCPLVPDLVLNSRLANRDMPGACIRVCLVSHARPFQRQHACAPGLVRGAVCSCVGRQWECRAMRPHRDPITTTPPLCVAHQSAEVRDTRSARRRLPARA